MNSLRYCARIFFAASSGVPRSRGFTNLVLDGEEIDTNMFSSTDDGLRKNTSLPDPLTSIQSSGRKSLYPSMVSLNGRKPGGGRVNAETGWAGAARVDAMSATPAPNARRPRTAGCERDGALLSSEDDDPAAAHVTIGARAVVRDAPRAPARAATHTVALWETEDMVAKADSPSKRARLCAVPRVGGTAYPLRKGTDRLATTRLAPNRRLFWKCRCPTRNTPPPATPSWRKHFFVTYVIQQHRVT
ncbi:hypothetical protein N9M16_07850 [Candidatus Dependentiae bacterium]|nr:hypothetical protein [Candidatus Dependentiae bacterium]